MTEYYETHAHYDDKRFDPDRDELLGTLLPEAGITRVLNIGADVRSSKEGIEYAERYAYMRASVGVHPHNTKDMRDSDLDVLLRLSGHDRVAAIGEIGLDYHYDFSPRDIQRKRFREQLELAKAAKLPVIIHSREADEDTRSILKEYTPSLYGGVLHCFGGNAEQALAYVDMGFYIAFGGVITFPKAVESAEAALRVPMNRILIETDCPYMSPVPMRGKRNDSRNLAHICKKLAEIKGVSHEEAARETFANAERLFGGFA